MYHSALVERDAVNAAKEAAKDVIQRVMATGKTLEPIIDVLSSIKVRLDELGVHDAAVDGYLDTATMQLSQSARDLSGIISVATRIAQIG
jgi:hypothetical protein